MSTDFFYPQTRVVGGGHTIFFWGGAPIALLDQVSDRGQTPQGTPYEAITSIGDNYPREIVTQPVLSEGQITLTMREVWNAPVWYRLGAEVSGDALTVPANGYLTQQGVGELLDIQQVFRAQNQYYQTHQGTGIQVMEFIYPPNRDTPIRGKVFHNATITAIDDGDQVAVAGLSITKTISVVYTHTTGLDGNGRARPNSQFNRR